MRHSSSSNTAAVNSIPAPVVGNKHPSLLAHVMKVRVQHSHLNLVLERVTSDEGKRQTIVYTKSNVAGVAVDVCRPRITTLAEGVCTCAQATSAAARESSQTRIAKDTDSAQM